MIVVSDASALINLARISKLELLRDLYTDLIVPEAVWQEVVIEGIGYAGADEIKNASWIKKYAVANRQLVQALRQDLDAGEAEAIALALEVKADLLLMDERLGRETARYLGLRYIGLIGVLIEAKHRGRIKAIKSYLDELRNVAHFRIKEELYHRVLNDEMEDY